MVSSQTYAQLLAVALALEVVLVALATAEREHLALALRDVEVPPLDRAEAGRPHLAHFDRHAPAGGNDARLSGAALILLGDDADVTEVCVAALGRLRGVRAADRLLSGFVEERAAEGAHIDGGVELNCKWSGLRLEWGS